MCEHPHDEAPPDGCPADYLTDAERQPCEVWSRVMGYCRPVASWNVGKRAEWRERTFFTEASSARLMAPESRQGSPP